MQCAICQQTVNDCVSCYGCKNHLCYGCAGLEEKSYRRFNQDKTLAWRCAHFKNTKNEPSVNEVILKEIRDIKSRVNSIPELLEDVKTIKCELEELKDACNENNKRLNEFDAIIATMEENVSEINHIKDKLAITRVYFDRIHHEILLKEQWSRLNNIEIKGVPIKTGENLFQIHEALCKAIGFDVPKSQIDYIARVPSHNSKNKLIIVRYINRYTKQDFIATARAKKELYTKDIGFTGSRNRVFVNDQKTPHFKSLLTKVKALAKKKNYSYVWVKFGKIHVRKNDTSHTFIVQKESDLNKIA
ncbi:unnamed protein product [Parnassius apollo]|uniref:(apollo) hypothetical protein n=1 Tax=Parnassius apollo TaxID=110799 RepID=A0A8S3X2I1_PARAO|nr:unnamed protein product [Parnassius apollo]